MPDVQELGRLLALVKFDASLNVIEGLDAFRRLLAKDAGGDVLQFLKREMATLEGKRRGAIAFVLAEHYRQTGDLANVQTLFAVDDAEVQESVLNAPWGEPGANPQMGPGIVQLAVQGAVHPSPGVRTEACYVFQNQCAWKVDVSSAVAPLQTLLDDQIPRVRHQAAFAVGNLAKRKYDMSSHVVPLRRNLKHEVNFVRDASAWALWQLSRHKHDISSAVPDLVELLTDDDESDRPRKNAAGALLHHARKSAGSAREVNKAVSRAKLDLNRREIKRFLDQLANLRHPEAREP
ncbi:MAG: hypothetical protein HY290_22365 [Planctomycetia bacterium]|nr:hypothetical protein [Planctomycetia bacterium]